MLFIFDMGGVVTNTFNYEAFFSKLNLTSVEFYDICKKQDDLWERLQTGRVEIGDFWKLFNQKCRELKLDKVPQVKNDLFRLYFHPSKNPLTVELILQLKKKHRVVCGTNTIQSHWENHLERGDYAFFNQTYASNKIGEAKPNPNFFKLILEAEGYKAQEAFFTDDKIENIEAAKSCGINALQFTSAQSLLAEWKKYTE